VYGAGVPAPPNLEVADLRFPSNKQNTAAGTSPLRSSPLSPFSAAAAKTQDAAPANNLLKQQVLQRDQAAHKKRALTGTLGRSVIKPAAGAGAKQPADSVPKDPRSLMLQTVRDALPAKSRALLDPLAGGPSEEVEGTLLRVDGLPDRTRTEDGHVWIALEDLRKLFTEGSGRALLQG